METQLVYDNQKKCLGLRFRETILTSGNGILGNLALKVHGVLNTRSGKQQGHSSMIPSGCSLQWPITWWVLPHAGLCGSLVPAAAAECGTAGTTGIDPDLQGAVAALP